MPHHVNTLSFIRIHQRHYSIKFSIYCYYCCCCLYVWCGVVYRSQQRSHCADFSEYSHFPLSSFHSLSLSLSRSVSFSLLSRSNNDANLINNNNNIKYVLYTLITFGMKGNIALCCALFFLRRKCVLYWVIGDARHVEIEMIAFCTNKKIFGELNVK